MIRLTITSLRLDSLLQMHVNRETVRGQDGDAVTKQVTFGRLPQCLCLHIQRTSYEHGFPEKRSDHVAFPMLLDMSPHLFSTHVSADARMRREKNYNALDTSSTVARFQNLYRLCSVIVHLGVINSGHYVTYRRGPPDGRFQCTWFLISDDVVEEVSDATVLKASAYMLLYERLRYNVVDGGPRPSTAVKANTT